MLLLVSGSTASIRKYARASNAKLGHLLTPDNWNSIHTIKKTGLPWACDNAAFGNFDADKFRKMLAKVKGHNPMWIACPDRVGCAKTTLAMFEDWQEEVREAGPIAFVMQDGQENEELPVADCYFIGGTTKWKLSTALGELAEYVHLVCRADLHMGRVNSFRRIQAAYDIFCHSFDGTSASKWGDVWIPRYLNCMERIEMQPKLPPWREMPKRTALSRARGRNSVDI